MTLDTVPHRQVIIVSAVGVAAVAVMVGAGGEAAAPALVIIPAVTIIIIIITNITVSISDLGLPVVVALVVVGEVLGPRNRPAQRLALHRCNSEVTQGSSVFSNVMCCHVM